MYFNSFIICHQNLLLLLIKKEIKQCPTVQKVTKKLRIYLVFEICFASLNVFFFLEPQLCDEPD